MSLKGKLNKVIQERGYISYDEAEELTKAFGHRWETGRRELRLSRSPLVKTERGSKGAVTGYSWNPQGLVQKADTEASIGQETGLYGEIKQQSGANAINL